MLFFLSIFFNNRLNLIFFIILLNIIISLFYFDNVIYCMPEQDNTINNTVINNDSNNTNNNPILDTIIRVETTPRNMINMLTNLGLSGATLYAGYYGIKSASWVSSSFGGSVGTKTTLTLSLFATGSFFGLGVYAISRAFGPSGPFINVNIGGSESNRIPVTDTSTSNHTVNCPLEIGDIIFHPFANLNPLAENPNLALLSVSILMLMLGIQCFNFILFRMFIIKYASRILTFLSSYPFLHNIFDKLVYVLNKTYKLYIYSFAIIGYFNLISALIFLLFFINISTNFN